MKRETPGRVIAVYRVVSGGSESAVDVKNRLLALEPNILVEEPLALGMSAFRFTKVLPGGESGAAGLEGQLRGVKGIVRVERVSLSGT